MFKRKANDKINDKINDRINDKIKNISFTPGWRSGLRGLKNTGKNGGSPWSITSFRQV